MKKKIVIFAVSAVTEETAIMHLINNTRLPLGVITVIPEDVIDNPEFVKSIKQKQEETKFTRAVKGIVKALESTIDQSLGAEAAFRASFWKAVLVDGAIDPAILKIVAFGPTCAVEYDVVEEYHLQFLPQLATSALIALSDIS